MTHDSSIYSDLASDRAFHAGVAALEVCPSFERALAFLLFGVAQEFFPEGNQRVSRLMMNGILMSHGIDAIGVPASRARDWNEKMERFERSRDAAEMMALLLDCHPTATISPPGFSRRSELPSLRLP